MLQKHYQFVMCLVILLFFLKKKEKKETRIEKERARAKQIKKIILKLDRCINEFRLSHYMSVTEKRRRIKPTAAYIIYDDSQLLTCG